MTECPERAQLLELLDERLGAAEADALDRHLHTCPLCRATLQTLTAAPELAGCQYGFGGHPRSTPLLSLGAEPSEDFLDHVCRSLRDTLRLPGSEANAAPAPLSATAPPGFELLGELGRGGTGVVFKARQSGLGRLVALKMLHAGSWPDADVRARFRREAEAAGRLQHPHIVQVFEVGEHDGRPFLVLEYVAGGSLQKRLTGPKSPRTAAGLLEVVARAVQHAHEQGIVHRDLKPANILLSVHGDPSPVAFNGPPKTGQPTSDLWLLTATPKLTDFGLAKELTANHGLTRTGDIIGTPSYMAPEQATASSDKIGPATDVYSLGVILYELLTGRPPFHAESHLETLVQVAHHEPVAPRRLQPRVPHDLETICMKCLEKEPRRRYASASELANDLRRHLDGQTIHARPAGTCERAYKWARRRPAVAALMALVVLVTLLGVGLVGWKWREAEANAQAEREARQDAQQKADDEAQARREVERLLTTADVDRALTVCSQGNVAQGLLWLAANLEQAQRLGDADLERVIRVNLTGWHGQLMLPGPSLSHADWTWDVAFSPDGRLAATASKDNTAALWHVPGGNHACVPLRHDLPVWSVAFSPDGRTVLTGSGAQDGTRGEARFWDATTGQPRDLRLDTGASIWTAAYSRDGRRVLILTARQVQLWDITTAPPTVQRLPQPGCRVALFSPDGRSVLTGGNDGTARLWDGVTGEPLGEPLRHAGPVLTAAFHPEGRLVAAGCALKPTGSAKHPGGEVHLWDAACGKLQAPPLPHRGPLKAVTFSADGQWLLSGGLVMPNETNNGIRGEARLWEVSSARPLCPPLEHAEPVWAVAFSPDGRSCATGCEDRHARVWLTATGQPLTPPLELGGNVRALVFHPDGRTLLTGSAASSTAARWWTVPSGRGAAPPLLLEKGAAAAALSRDGKTFVNATGDGAVQFWNFATRERIGEVAGLPSPVMVVAVTPDGRFAAVGSASGEVQLWDVVRRQPHSPPLQGFGDLHYALKFSPDGKTLMAASWGAQGVRRWQLVPGKWLEPALSHPPAWTADWSPDGRLIATGGNNGVRIWDASTGKLKGEFLQQEGKIQTLVFSPDSRRMLVANGGRLPRVWAADTGKAVGSPLAHPDRVLTGAFSPDGRTVLTGSADRTGRWWDVATGKPLGPPLQHRAAVGWLTFLPDGQRAAALAGNAVQFWDLPTPWPGPVDRVRLEFEVMLGMELDETRAIRVLPAEDLKQRRQVLTPGSRMLP